LHKIKEIYKVLDEISPFELQEKWDNSGLIIGNMEDEFETVYISIDLDEDVLKNIPSKSLIITHHPLIFSPLKTINFDSYSTKLLKILIQKEISLISMHTNIDKTHLNKYVCENILGFTLESSEDFICNIRTNISFNNLVEQVSNKLNLSHPKTVKCHDHINSIAITTGSGMSLISNIQADCFLTGDIKYHDAMEAKSRGISLIDIGHWESEQYFTRLLMGLLPENLKNKQLKAIMSNSNNPFTTSGE